MQQLTTIRRASLADQVVDQLRGLIERGGLTAGDRLPSELELTKRLGVSRNVLREAVGRLESLGMVQVRRGYGMYVGDRSALAACAKLARSALAISSDDLTEVAELRVAVECHAARRAAQLATAEQMDELQAAMEEIGREDQSDEQSVRADWAFHRKVIEIGGSKLLRSLMAVIEEFLIVGIMEAPGVLDRTGRMKSHQDLVDAICAGDADEAQRAARQHVESWSKRLIKHVAAAKDPSE